jgi:FkbM family methyltransferase
MTVAVRSTRLRLRPAGPLVGVRDVLPSPISVWSPISARLPDVSRNAVIHIGAHVGEELESYLHAGFNAIYLVEANPVVFPRLSAHAQFWKDWLFTIGKAYNLENMPRIACFNQALWHRAELMTFYTTEAPLQSSLLCPIDPQIKATGAIRLRTKCLDDLVATSNIDLANGGLLVVDVQGAECQVLAGGVRTLSQVNAVIAEISDAQRYHGQSQEAQLDELLRRSGFVRTGRNQQGQIENVLYVRQFGA